LAGTLSLSLTYLSLWLAVAKLDAVYISAAIFAPGIEASSGSA